MNLLENTKFQEYLEKEGWTIECESPLEIRHTDGSFATKAAAKILVDELSKQYKEEYGLVDENLEDYPHQKRLEKLTHLFNSMEQYIQTCYEQEQKDVKEGRELGDQGLSAQSYELWKTTYDLVFSDKISRPIRAILQELDMELEYYDPDTSYKEDVLAYYDAVKGQIKNLEKLVVPTSSRMRP